MGMEELYIFVAIFDELYILLELHVDNRLNNGHESGQTIYICCCI